MIVHYMGKFYHFEFPHIVYKILFFSNFTIMKKNLSIYFNCRKSHSQNSFQIMHIIEHIKIAKIPNFFVRNTLLKTLNANISLNIDFEAYSLKFWFSAVHNTVLYFFLLPFRHNEIFSLFSILCSYLGKILV